MFGAGAGIGILGNAAGLGLSALGAGGSILGGAASNIGGTVASSIVGGISTVLRGGNFAAAVTTAIGGALTGAIVAGITSSVRSAVAKSQSILALSQASGMGLSASARGSYNLSAFGVSASNVGAMNNPMAGMTASMYGVQGAPGSAEYLRSYSQRYTALQSQGLSGRMQAQGMESGMGMEGARFIAGLSDSQRERQFSRSASMQSSLGMNPADVRRNAQEMTLLGASFKQFFGLLQERGGSRIIEHLVTPLNNLFDWIESKGSGLGDGIERGVDRAFEALHSVGSWLYAEFPHMVLGSIETIASTAGDLAAMLPDTFSELGNMVRFALMDALNPVPGMIGEMFAPVGDYLSATALPPLKAFFDGVQGAIQGLLNNPQIAALMRTAERVATNFLPVTSGINNTMGNVAGSLGAPEWAEDALRGGGGALLAYQGGKALLKRGLGRGIGGAATESSGGMARGFMRGLGNVARWAGRGIGTVGRMAIGGISATAAGITAAGVGLGVAGYEGLRAMNIGGFGDNTYSVKDMAKNWWGGGETAAGQAPASQAPASAFDNVSANLAGMGGNALKAWDKMTTRPADYQRVSNSTSGWDNSLKGLREGFVAQANKLENVAKEKRDELGSVEQRRNEYLASIATNTKRTADATENMPVILDRFGMSIAAQALKMERQDMAMVNIRAGGRT